MLLSVTSAAPRNVESVRSKDLIPSALQNNASTLLDVIEEYYNYLNTTDLPTNEIASIRTLKDIDAKSFKYINQIEELIGKSIPKSIVINRVELYKIIVRYYNTRGSEDSIHSFFKIFFDEFVKIVYPKDFLFDLSGATGYWTANKEILTAGGEFEIRQLTDETIQTIDGITYSSIATDGSGQLISIQYKEEDADSYEIKTEYSYGLTTITPGAKSRIIVDASDVFGAGSTFGIPENLYFLEFGINGKPIYSERNEFISQINQSYTRIEWDGTKWDFTIGSSLGDIVAFYSTEDVADPTLVTSWTLGWVSSSTIDITGTINDLTFGRAFNSQIFNALHHNEDFRVNVLTSADILAATWTEEYTTTTRTYLSTDLLPTNVAAGTLAVVNGAKIRPYVLGIAVLKDASIVWQQYITDEWVYENNKSFASDRYKIFDGYYWQDYSYVIKSNLDSSFWYNEYKKFVHPAGLKMFSAIALEMFARNEWFEKLDYSTTDINTDDSWMQALIPSHRLNYKKFGFHTPKFQPGWLRELYLKFIFTYLKADNHDTDLVRMVIINYLIQTVYPADARNSFVRKQYQISEKFIDPSHIGAGWLNHVIADADEPYSMTNRCKMLNISTFINLGSAFTTSYVDIEDIVSAASWDDSYYDPDGGDASGDWDASTITPAADTFTLAFTEVGTDVNPTWNMSYSDTADGAGSGIWSGSSFENI